MNRRRRKKVKLTSTGYRPLGKETDVPTTSCVQGLEHLYDVLNVRSYAERTPLAIGDDAAKATFTTKGSDVTLTVGESPTYVWIHAL